jgi:Uma2 family endonuclease
MGGVIVGCVLLAQKRILRFTNPIDLLALNNKRSPSAPIMTVATDRGSQPPLQLLPKPVTFDEFINWYPENSEFRYELRRGVIIEMPKPKGDHSMLAGGRATDLALEIRQQNLPYFIPKECVIKVGADNGYEPDVIVLDRAALATEPRWDSASTVEQAASIRLVIEVVSTNWQDDYEVKMAAYEALGIAEYWIIDYAGLGGIRHIGRPKQPTVTIATLIDGEYETRMFRGDEVIISTTFPALKLTAAQVMRLG